MRSPRRTERHAARLLGVCFRAPGADAAGPCQIGFRCTRLAYSALTCPAASFCRKSSHGHKVRGHRRGLRPQKPGCAFFDPQDTMHSQAGCEPAGTPRALVRSASAAPRQTQRTTCMHPYEPSAPPVGTCRAVACACALSSHRRQRPRQKELSRDSFSHELVTRAACKPLHRLNRSIFFSGTPLLPVK